MSNIANTAENSRLVRLHITCVTPPPVPPDIDDIESGLQDRHELLFPGQLQSDGSLQYEIEAIVNYRPETAEVRWQGPYVHGKPSASFLYVSMRRRSVQPTGWIRRLKVPLPRLSWDHIEAMHATPCFAVSISGKGSGTVPLLGDGWVLREHPAAGQ